MNKFLIVFILFASIFASDDFYFTKGKKVFIKKSHSRGLDNVYIGEHNTTLKVSGEIIVNFKNIALKDKIKKKYNLIEIKNLYDNIYLFKVKNIEKTLDIANKIYENEDVIFSHPNFKIKPQKRTLDPYYKDAWHLHGNNSKTHINIEEAFIFTKGANTKVGIYDDGIDIYHEDLIRNMALAKKDDKVSPASFSFSRRHGTQVVGVLSAMENNKGSVGVAPKSKIHFIEYESPIDYVKTYEMFDYLDKLGVPIIINSWGTYHAHDYFYNFIKKLATKGRNGKGLIIIFASGNNGYDYDKDLSLVDESESEYVISVSATDRNGKLAYYSSRGKSIDISAPGGDFGNKNGIITTSINSRYDKYFIGTSASVPMVGGSLALALDINPDLTRDDLLDILNKTSSKIGDTPYINGKNKYFGYGLLNAGKIVKEAILSYEKSLKGKTFPIIGTFIEHNNGFIYKNSKNIFSRLDRRYARNIDPYGFTSTNITNNKKSSMYLIKIRNIDEETLNIQDLALIDMSTSSLYKLTKLDKSFVEYSFPLKMEPVLTRNAINNEITIFFK